MLCERGMCTSNICLHLLFIKLRLITSYSNITLLGTLSTDALRRLYSLPRPILFCCPFWFLKNFFSMPLPYFRSARLLIFPSNSLQLTLVGKKKLTLNFFLIFSLVQHKKECKLLWKATRTKYKMYKISQYIFIIVCRKAPRTLWRREERLPQYLPTWTLDKGCSRFMVKPSSKLSY